jgi:catechol 2,3-dioxygenase-like lactoylglutathione lyase family enzyme
MLLKGFQHVALMTSDIDRLCTFYEEVFDATTHPNPDMPPGMRMAFIDLGGGAEFNVFEVEGNSEGGRVKPDFERGHLDHFGLQAESKESFLELRRRLIERGATDGFVTDFGPVHSVYFEDPDGMGCEVCVWVRDGDWSVLHPPGTPAEGYDQPS